MKKGVRIAVIASAVVAVIAVASGVSSAGQINLFPSPPTTSANATPDHVNQEIDVVWGQAFCITYEGNESCPSGYELKYWADGSSSKTTVSISSASTTSWTHTNPTVGTKYWYSVAVKMVGVGPHSTAVSATVLELPTVTSGSFSESTNTISLTASQSLNAAKASNICIHNTIKIGNSSQQFDRCGTSASVSGTSVTVTVSGEYSVNATVTSETIGIGTNAIRNTNNLWNAVWQQIWIAGS